CHQYNSLPFTF
nr:immunoglobulin light chain junction region [Macaca mulatta]MOW12872.1 immunoglobulin light chain junction region [Macaca mulatta]